MRCECLIKTLLGLVKVYFSAITHLAVRAWKKHNRVTCNLMVISGTVKFVIRINDFEFEEYILNSENNTRLTIPCGYWFGFQGVGLGENLIMNARMRFTIPMRHKEKVVSNLNICGGR